MHLCIHIHVHVCTPICMHVYNCGLYVCRSCEYIYLEPSPQGNRMSPLRPTARSSCWAATPQVPACARLCSTASGLQNCFVLQLTAL